MSEQEMPETPKAADPNQKAPRKRGRIRWVHWAGIPSGVLMFLIIVAAIGLYYYASSAAFENTVRRRVIAELENLTGGRVEIQAFHWDLLHLRVDVSDVTIHGLEAANEAPYAHVDRLRMRAQVIGLFTLSFSPRILLSEAEIDRPQFHLIVYPDGSTNQPHPRHKPKPRKPFMDTLFDAQVGRLSVRQGTMHLAGFVVPLDLDARDASLQLNWEPDTSASIGPVGVKGKANPAGSYRITAGVGQIAFAQNKLPPISSRIDVSLRLFHDSIELDSLRLTALDRVLTVRGSCTDFLHAAWQAQANGQVDLRVIAPYTGFPFTRTGVVDLNANGSGRGTAFTATGELASDAIHYKDPFVDAKAVAFSARFRADAKQFFASDVHTKLPEGGQVDGEFQFDNWLDFTPMPAQQAELRRAHKSWPVPTGVVHANLRGVSLDTILILLASPQYRHLGLDAIVSGPATARWTGLAADLAIGGQLALAPSAVPVPGEVPVNGSVDGEFHADAGSIDVRALDVRLPHSTIEGSGLLGVFPITRGSQMSLDLQSSDLAEFDAVLRTLELERGDRTGTAALPVSLKGHAEFRGQFSSSWLTPRVEGHLSATDIGVEIPSATEEGNPNIARPNPPPTFVHWDSAEVDGAYTPASITVRRGIFRRASASLILQGHLDAANSAYKIGDSEPEFDAHSILALQANAQQVSLVDILPLAGITAPVTGKLTAQADIHGEVGNPIGTGTVDVENAVLYGQPIAHIHAAGTANDRQVKITNLVAQQSANGKGGRVTGSGSFGLDSRSVQVDMHGAAIDLASLSVLKDAGVTIAGKLDFAADGGGTISDPHFNAHATFSNMSVGGEPVADLQFTATGRQQMASYDLSSHQPTGDFSAHGDTSLKAGYETQAALKFARFDIGALLKTLHFTGITGKSDMEGTAKISGPLAQPEKLRGEAALNELAVVVENVHLASKGPVHATMVGGVARLDPVEITGEDTDLKVHGSLAITGKRQLDLQADGAVNMRLAETLDSDLSASGVTTFQMEAHGPLSDPNLQGKVEFSNVAVALQDFPNGLSQVKGTLEFNQNRLEVRSLTAMSGGGQLSVGGYVGFQHGLYADLTATGKSIRIRYPQGISSLADANMRLQGPQNNLLLSGNVQVIRFAINSELDIAALTSQSKSVQPIVAPDAPSNHVRLDVHLTSAPQLTFQNAYAKLAGDVDLHLRGTLASPSLLGRISLTEGSTSISGTKYELQRGDIIFNNPVRIQPSIDIDATARVEDYDITLGLHGTTDKPRLTYRSEPPLPESDIIALLALGHTQEENTTYVQQQQQAGDNPMTDALLGGALNATVSSRVQRLFGTGAIKIDPNFIGSLGNSTARVTVVEQVGNNLTFTYASNVNTTSQQLIQAEIAINRHVSLVLTQDESGIFSGVLKIRRRFK